MFLPAYTRLLLEMHKQKPFTGNFLCIGRQTVPFTFDEAAKFLEAEGIEPRTNVVKSWDDCTVNRKPGYIDDHTFFSMFCDATVRALDISRYEHASILHDMNMPVPQSLHAIADFIFEGSCLDNMFNPAQAMLNIDAMLKPNGRSRLFMVNAGNIVPKDTYIAMGEEWYRGFLKANGYNNIQVSTWSYDKVDDPIWHRDGNGKNCCVVVKATKPFQFVHKPTQPIQYGYALQHRPVRHKLKNFAGRVARKAARVLHI